MHELYITLADGSSRVLRLTEKPILLGREPSCDLAFPSDPELSRRHLVVEPDQNRWAVRDLGSTNGTRLNGQPLQTKHILKPGDKISASHITMLYREAEPPKNRTVFFDASRMEAHPSTVAIHLSDLLDSQTSERLSPEPTSGSAWVTPLQALLRVGRELVQGRPLEELFGVILNLALEGVGAERGVLMAEEGDELIEKASRGGEFRISTAVRDRVMNHRESVLIESVADTPAMLSSKTIMLQGVRSLIAVPLQTDTRVIGLLYVDARNALRRFTNDDLGLLTVMANVAAMRIERQRLAEIEESQRRHEAELNQAAEIQKRHLPRTAPVWNGMEIAGMHSACLTVGGDYFDYLTLCDGRLGIVVADVAGKGMPAALMMMSLQARVQALAETCTDMSDFVTRLNRNMLPSCAPNKFVTMFAGSLDAATGELQYTNAGHLPGLLVRTGGEVERLTEGGMFVGLLPNLEYERLTAILHEGDLLVLYTDGITEQENASGDDYGVDRLEQEVTPRRDWPLEKLIAHVTAQVSAWAAGVPVSDDQTIVMVRRSNGLNVTAGPLVIRE